MSEKIVTLRHDQICDVCKHPIKAGKKAYMIRDDFWPSMVWFEHVGGCPGGVPASLSEATGADARDILASLDSGFWEEATRPEARRIMELLLAGATLHPDRLELEVNIDGIEQLEKEIEDGQGYKD